MSEHSLPADFLGCDVQIQLQGDQTVMSGRIVGHLLPYYIEVRTKSTTSVIPWTSVLNIWVVTEKVDAPPSRQTRQEQASKELGTVSFKRHEISQSNLPPELSSEKEAEAVLNWDPDNLEWESYTAQSGKETERYPFEGHKAESKPDYHNLIKAIQTVNSQGKSWFTSGAYFYWTRDGVIYRRKHKPRRG